MEFEQTISDELHKLAPSALLELYELDATVLNDTIYYFHAGTNHLTDPLVFGNNTYNAMPVEVRGFEMRGKGELPHPSFKIANIAGFIRQLVLDTDDVVGATFTRRRIFKKHLDLYRVKGELPAELPKDIFYIIRKVTETPILVEFELGASYDIEEIKLPRRQINSHVCGWMYRGESCGFNENRVVAGADGVIIGGGKNFVGPWILLTGNALISYVVDDVVSYTTGGAERIYKCTAATTSIAGREPTNVAYWTEIQKNRGEWSSTVSDYVKGDVAYRIINEIKYFFYAFTTVPTDLQPPDTNYWQADRCSKLIGSGCRLRYDPKGAFRPLPFGAFPGSARLPTI